MHAVVIAGPKRSGKTALAALVAEALERFGKRVAIVKYSSRALDRGNTDAFWLMRPGRVVVNASPKETAVFWPEERAFEDLIAHLGVDVVICEGGDVPAYVPRIFCCHEDAEEEDCFSGNVSFSILATYGSGEALPGIPHFVELSPVAVETLASLILEKGEVKA